MFIARSAARVRMARAIFLLCGALPCVALVAWAGWQRSAARRDAVRDRWQEVIGLPLVIGSVEQPRPGVLRGRRVAVLAADGGVLVEMPTVELESSAAEDRLRIDAFRCDAGVAAVVAALGREWLARDVRFPRTCIIEVADFAWRAPAPLQPAVDEAASIGLRVECVARVESRAIRVVRRGDEVRVVRMRPSAEQREETTAWHAAWQEPLPLGVCSELCGWAGWSVRLPASATVSGAFDARVSAAGWAGTAHGRVEGIDIGSCAQPLEARAAGRATITIEQARWNRSRLVDAVVSCEVGSGWIDARLFDRFTVALGCRPGAAAAGLAAERSFDAAGAVLRFGGDGLRISAPPGSGGALASARGTAVLQPPTGPIAIDRLAWMMAPPGTPFVPAEGPGAWLMSVLGPEGKAGPGERGGRAAAGGGNTPGRDF